MNDYKKKILENGYVIIDNYMDNDICNSIINDINKNINIFTKCVINNNIFNSGNDLRMTHFENINVYAKNFLYDLQIHTLFENILERKIETKRCQAGIVKFINNEICCSGGGWHIDNKNIQLKAILYLSDVNQNNGPFQYIKKTQGGLNLENTIGDISNTRFDDNTIQNSDKIDKNNIIEICGKAGTLILVRTDNIHKGKIIENGIRYTLTNYYY